jgi:hypothetical protein
VREREKALSRFLQQLSQLLIQPSLQLLQLLQQLATTMVAGTAATVV